MDNSKLTRVMAETAASCKQQKMKWARAAFMRFFASPEKMKLVKCKEAVSEEVRPVMAEEAVSTPVKEVVPALVEVREEPPQTAQQLFSGVEEVADTPPSPSSSTSEFSVTAEEVAPAMEAVLETPQVSTVLVEEVVSLVPELQASSSSFFLDPVPSTSWSNTTREVLDKELLRPGTKRQYKLYWNKFTDFCQEENVPVFPFNCEVVSDFLISLATTVKNKNAPNMARTAIKHFHGLECPDLEDPTDSKRVRDVVKCVTKMFSKEVKKAKPVSSEDVAKLVCSLDLDCYKHLRTAAFVILMFNLMGRFSDIQYVRVEDVQPVEGGHLKVKIVIANNYESYEAQTSYMVGNPEGMVFCVDIVRRLMEARGGSPRDYLFTNFRFVQGKLVVLDTVVTYDNFLKLFRAALVKADLPGVDFSLHSVKSGAFSEARNSGKVSVSVLRRHARWVSRKTVHRYFSMSLEVCLQSTRALRLNQNWNQ